MWLAKQHLDWWYTRAFVDREEEKCIGRKYETMYKCNWNENETDIIKWRVLEIDVKYGKILNDIILTQMLRLEGSGVNWPMARMH